MVILYVNCLCFAGVDAVVSDIPEADAKHIATLACEAFAKYVLL